MPRRLRATPRPPAQANQQQLCLRCRCHHNRPQRRHHHRRVSPRSCRLSYYCRHHRRFRRHHCCRRRRHSPCRRLWTSLPHWACVSQTTHGRRYRGGSNGLARASAARPGAPGTAGVLLKALLRLRPRSRQLWLRHGPHSIPRRVYRLPATRRAHPAGGSHRCARGPHRRPHSAVKAALRRHQRLPSWRCGPRRIGIGKLPARGRGRCTGAAPPT